MDALFLLTNTPKETTTDKPGEGPDFAKLDFGNADPDQPDIVGEKVGIVMEDHTNHWNMKRVSQNYASHLRIRSNIIIIYMTLGG